MADSSTKKNRTEEYGVRTVEGRWSKWTMDGNGLDCETKEQTSGLSPEDLAWLIEPHRELLFPAESPQPKAQGDGWVKAEALPSWLTGQYWLQFDDGSVGARPAWRDNGSWFYDEKFTAREHGQVIAFCPAKPPPPPKVP